MRHQLASVRLLKAPFKFREEIETLDRIFHRSIVGQVLNNPDDLTLYWWRFHDAISLA